LSDDEVLRARTGDEAALRGLYESYRPRVLRLAFGLLGDADEAEDAMQDVMVYALTHLDRYDSDRAAFGTWLHTITVSRCRDRLRRRHLGLRRLAEWVGLRRADPLPSIDERAERLDAADSVGAALGSLTDIQREAILLREVEGLSFREIGDVLGVPLRTAQTRVASAHEALRRGLAGQGARSHGARADGSTQRGET